MKSCFRWLSVVAVVLSPIYLPLKTVAIFNQKLQPQSQSADFRMIAQADSNKFDLKDFDFWSNQCLLLSQEKQFTQVLAACEQAISLKPKSKNAELWSARSQALFHMGRYAESFTSYKRVVEAVPNHSLAIAYQCAALFQLDKYEDAVDTCDRALQVNGNWGDASPSFAWLYRGLALRKLGSLETALLSYNRARSANSDDSLIKAEWCSTLAEIGLDEKQKYLEQYGKDKNCGLLSAIAFYEGALANDSNNVTIWIQQGLALEQAGLFERALTSYDRAIQLNPKNAFVLAHRCSVLNALENYKAALESCENALANIEQIDKFALAYLWTQRSGALIGLAKYEEALATAERALAINPEYAPSYTARAVSLWGLNRSLEARAVIKQAIDIYEQNKKKAVFQETFARKYPDSPMVFYRGLFLARYNQGRILSSTDLAKNEMYNQEAVKAYENALKSLEDYKKALNIEEKTLDYNLNAVDKRILSNVYANQAAAYLRLSLYQEALERTDKAVKLNPESFAGWYNQALALLKLSEKKNPLSTDVLKAALKAYEKAESLNPNNKYVLTGKSLILQNLERFTDALATFDKVLALDPNNMQIIAAKGTTLEKVGRFQEAIAIYDQVLGNEPKNIKFIMAKGSALQNLQKFEEAISVYDKVLKEEPENIYILTAKGTALENSGKEPEAIDIYNQVLNIDSGYKPAQERYNVLKKFIQVPKTPSPTTTPSKNNPPISNHELKK